MRGFGAIMDWYGRPKHHLDNHMREKILEALRQFHHIQGIAFTSGKDAEDYFKGLVILIENLIDESP